MGTNEVSIKSIYVVIIISLTTLIARGAKMKLLIALLIVASSGLKAEVKFNVEDGLFINGYDPVSYIKESKAQEGKEELVYEYKDLKIRFSSQENLDLFKKGPEKYMPIYNGWCAYAMSKGEFVEINPEYFKVIDGKTHLFFKNWIFNTLESWKQNEQTLKRKADSNWKKLISKK